MSLGPEDLPEDPFGETGVAQLICGCTCELFLFVFTETTVKAICSGCGRVNGEWQQRAAGPSPADQQRAATEYARKLDPDPEVSAAWLGPEILPQRDVVAPRELPPLPAFSPAICNIYLRGGPYDGQITWVGEDTDGFGVVGYGVYRPTGEKFEGRAVFALAPQ